MNLCNYMVRHCVQNTYYIYHCHSVIAGNAFTYKISLNFSSVYDTLVQANTLFFLLLQKKITIQKCIYVVYLPFPGDFCCLTFFLNCCFAHLIHFAQRAV